MIRKLVPQNWKLKIRLFRNTISDILNVYSFAYAKKRGAETTLNEVFSLTQDLKSNEFKKKNIALAKSLIEPLIIYPSEIFSFWKVVGEPSGKRGFVKSRSLINGVTSESFGGGLCQLSGLIYLTSLYCGLEILERHNHSLDIYNDNTRYMPLGGDATVAYGYKDLKIRNNLQGPISFSIEIKADTVTVAVKHIEKININTIDFVLREQNEHTKVVETLVNDKKVVTSTYKNVFKART